MADKLTRSEWNGVLEQAAIDAAAAYRKYVEKNSKLPTSDEYENGYKESFKKFLESKYPYEDVTNEDMVDLSNFSSDDIWKWEVYKDMGDAYDPRVKKEKAELEKYMPFLKGVAKDGEDWYSRKDLKLKGVDMGFDYSSEGLAEFLKNLEKYQTMYDRSQLVKEMRGTAPYVLGSLFAPSATQAIEGAVAKGEDLPASEAAKLAALDVGANTLMFEAPGLNLIKKGAVAAPILNSIIGTAGQFGGEIARQYGAQALNDNIEADPVAAITAATMGATRPAIVSTAAGLAAQVPGKGAQDFARGIMRATRAGNPAIQEREGVERLVKNYNKFVKDGTLSAPAGATKELVLDLNKKAELLETNKLRDLAKTYGVKPAKDGTYSAEDILKAYDKKFKGVVEVTPNGVIDPKVPLSNVGDNEILLTPLNSQNYSRFAGQKIAEEKNKTGWRNLGLGAGVLLGELGGRVEPIIKWNPTNIGTQAIRDYKDQSWYKKLKRANPEAAKVFEEVMKQKDEEE